MSKFKHALAHIKTFSVDFWIVIISTLMNQLGNMAFVFLILYLTESMHFSLTTASTAFASFSVSTFLTSLFGGSLIDKLGASRVMVVSLFLNGLLLLIFPLLINANHIFIVCLVWGLMFGLYRPASQTFISLLSTAGSHRLTFSVYRFAINLGMSLGPAMGGYLASISFKSIFIANGMANILACSILLFGLSKTIFAKSTTTAPEKSVPSLYWLIHDKTLRVFAIGMIPVAMVFFQHESTLSVFMRQDLHFPITYYGWLFTLNTLLIVFFEIPLNVLMMEWPYRTNFLLGSLLIVSAFSGLFFVTHFTQVMILAITWTVGEMIFYPTASSYITDISPEKHRGSYMSIFSACSNIGLLMGPWLGAIIMQHFGGRSLWVACAVCGSLSVLIYYRMKK